jgi:hypothetical protein
MWDSTKISTQAFRDKRGLMTTYHSNTRQLTKVKFILKLKFVLVHTILDVQKLVKRLTKLRIHKTHNIFFTMLTMFLPI